jgi:hypothetical protein
LKAFVFPLLLGPVSKERDRDQNFCFKGFFSQPDFCKSLCCCLKKELDKIQTRLSKMYDVRLDGMIDDALYQKKFRLHEVVVL